MRDLMLRSGTVSLNLAFVLCASAQTPTWNEDVSCIVYTHCTSCHHEGGSGHFSLTSYTDAVFWRNEMRAATQVRYMPPWPPDPQYRSLAHERVLSQGEIDIIAAWVDGGYPEGDPANALPPPTYTNAPMIIDPEITAIMEDFVIPPSTTDLYRCFVLDVDNPMDRFITAVEVLPGNTSMVHHVLLFQDVTGQARILDQNDPGPGYTSFGGIGVSNAKLIGAWVPGTRPFVAAPNMGIKLLANADLVMQVHYPASSLVEVDSTRVNLRMSSSNTLRNLSIEPALNHSPPSLQNGPFVIPASQVRTFHARYTVPIAITTTGIAPHAHLICKSMKAFAVLPSGDTLPLIDIPDWDFAWQGFYDFRNPIFFPAGTQVHGYATYDNTVNNPRNPNNPPQLVTLGEATTDEMMLFYFAYTPGVPSDTLIVIDDGTGPDPYMDCVSGASVGIGDPGNAQGISVWPSPASDRVFVSGIPAGGAARMFDGAGRMVGQLPATDALNGLDVSGFSPGLYLVEVFDISGDTVHRTKVIRSP